MNQQITYNALVGFELETIRKELGKEQSEISEITGISQPVLSRLEKGKAMIVVRALYGLKSSGDAFRLFLAETLIDIGFKPSLADPDIWMRPAMKSNGFKYWEFILCYVDDLLCIHKDPSIALKQIQTNFKFKDDKM